MRIAVDASYSAEPEPTGIGVYSAQLLKHLLNTNPADRILLCYRPKQYLQSLKSSGPQFRGTEFARRRLLQAPFPVLGSDVFHALNQRVDHRPSRRVVTTFHDLFVITSEYSTPEFRARFERQAKVAAANSDLIIAVSEFTASQLRDLLNVPGDRIRVIPHGVNEARPQSEVTREDLILFVGALQKRKNLVRLVKAFEKVPSNWRLVLAGAQGGFGADIILKAVEQSPAAMRIEVTGYLPAAALESLYCRASIFAFPSLDEGFGIPVLEAMAHGLPVLTSNRSALPEVAGDAALLVDPGRDDEVAEGLLKLTAEKQFRDDLRLRGYRHALQFSWRKTVEATYGVYKELVGM